MTSSGGGRLASDWRSVVVRRNGNASSPAVCTGTIALQIAVDQPIEVVLGTGDLDLRHVLEDLGCQALPGARSACLKRS